MSELPESLLIDETFLETFAPPSARRDKMVSHLRSEITNFDTLSKVQFLQLAIAYNCGVIDGISEAAGEAAAKIGHGC